MDIEEVIRLAGWYSENTRAVQKKYAALVGVLQNNSQQPTQQPVAEPLKELKSALAEMPTAKLSVLQLGVLERLGVSDLLGRRGKRWVDKKIRSTTYDPATTYQTLHEAHQRISSAQQILNTFRENAVSIGFSDAPFDIDLEHPYRVNVIFKEGASIDDVTEWKKSASEWELIFAGVSAVVGQRPEDVRVVGASSGSIILTVAASPLVAKVLASISKSIASIANDYLDFQMRREELERSRMMTEVIRTDLARQEKERRASGIDRIIDAVKEVAPNATEEAVAKLRKSVEKQIGFAERGGELDFVDERNGVGEVDEGLADDFEQIRVMIEQFRAEKQKYNLLTKPVEDPDDSDEGA